MSVRLFVYANDPTKSPCFVLLLEINKLSDMQILPTQHDLCEIVVINEVVQFDT